MRDRSLSGLEKGFSGPPFRKKPKDNYDALRTPSRQNCNFEQADSLFFPGRKKIPITKSKIAHSSFTSRFAGQDKNRRNFLKTRGST